MSYSKFADKWKTIVSSEEKKVKRIKELVENINQIEARIADRNRQIKQAIKAFENKKRLINA